jgi:ABC-type spermidine/putrescine transport system permease subunit I
MAIYLERTKSQMTAGADIFRRPKRPEVPVSRRYLGLTPQFLLFGLGFVVPFTLLVATSFGTMQFYQLKFGFRLDNYAELISSTTFWSALRGSIVSSALAAALVGLFALPVSLYLLLRASDTAKPIIIAVLLLPLLTNYVVRVYALKLALANNGIVNYALISLGAATEPARLLYTFPSVCLSFVLYFAAIGVLTQWAGVGRLSRVLLYTAADLGARPFRRLYAVVLPLVARGLGLQMGIVFAFAFSDTLIPQAIGGSRVFTLSLLLVDYFKVNDWPKAAATSMLMMAITLPVLVACLVIGLRISREAEWLAAR